MADKTADKKTRPRRPSHWDKMVAAAYLRIMGATQKEAAVSVGRSERTIRDWETDRDTWAEARAEAADRWLCDVIDAARNSVLTGAKRDPDMGFRILERVDPRLAPPKQKHEHSGEGGGPVEITVTRRIIRPSE